MRWVAIALVGCASSNAGVASTAAPPAATTRTTAATTTTTNDDRRRAIEIAVECSAHPESCADLYATNSGGPPCDVLTGAGVIRRGKGISPVATTAQQRAACSGAWGPMGIAQMVGCRCRTPDANRPCTSPLDCEAECLVLDPNARDLARACPELDAKFQGLCSGAYVNFGCLSRVVELPTPQGPLRQLQWSCLD